ncbi:VOC family protein [Neobacillus sp. MER 74]|uniref:VOC family protein n=1 Tax=Bacillaceae TaxID=186817 RepID=UPI000BFA2D95|nr:MULTISPECIES: VOC family protein [Bacillaceae]MCM3118714.1 VOC family protein [Neobacillus sp. MER 74]PFP29348.1 glyoxalase/bleomycin resistance/dioxygenase family protein [Bacillus sp. AFS073361]
MNSPIKNQINTIFVHVSDLEKSVIWYSQLLGQAYDTAEIRRPVYNIEINDHTGLTLDAGPEEIIKEANNYEYPLFNFHTDQINAAYNYVNSLGYKIESEIVNFDDFSYFTISDPDRNIIMVCTG